MAVVCLLAATQTPALAIESERASVDSSGREVQGASLRSALSADGRFLAFESDAPTIVPDDTRTNTDIFVRDRKAGTVARVSVSSTGAEAKGDSFAPSISADGRIVAFESAAWNLVDGDHNDSADVFVHDRLTNATKRVSVNPSGGDANGTSFAPDVSADGRFVAFQSVATNLVTGDDNGVMDVFVADLQTGEVSRVGALLEGVEPHRGAGDPAISANGRFVTFEATRADWAPGSTSVYVTDRATGTTTLLSEGQLAENPSISADGGLIAFRAGRGTEIYVARREGGPLERIDERLRYSRCGRKGDWFRCWQSPGASDNPSISADGRFVTFESNSLQLVRDNPYHGIQVFVADRSTGKITRISENRHGMSGDSCSASPVISGDGSTIAYKSSAANLVVGDRNATTDVFVAEAPCASNARRTLRSTASTGSRHIDDSVSCSWAN